MIPNYDQEIEKRYHPENFEPVDDCDRCDFEECDECGFYQGQLKNSPACIECGGKNKKIIKQCLKCGGAIRECCPNHEDIC